jgi:hypothetical protein
MYTLLNLARRSSSPASSAPAPPALFARKEGIAALGGGLGEFDICRGVRVFGVGRMEAASAPCVVDLAAFSGRSSSLSDESESELLDDEDEEDDEDEDEEAAISTSPAGWTGSSSELSLDEPDDEAE